MSSPDREHPRCALWLVPAEPDRCLLEGVMGELAGRYGAPRFVPHVTLFGGNRLAPRAVRATLAACARATTPLTLATAGIGHSGAFFQALFLVIADVAPVGRLRQELGRELGLDPAAAPRPHLSLIYAELPAAERRQLGGELRLPGSVRFDSLALVEPGDGESWHPVESWRIVQTHRLGAVGSSRTGN